MKKYSDKTYQSVHAKVAVAGAPEFFSEYLIKVSSCTRTPIDDVVICHLQPVISGIVGHEELSVVKEINIFTKFPTGNISVEKYLELLEESIPVVNKQYESTPRSYKESMDVLNER